MAVHNILPTSNLIYSDIRDTLNSGGGSVNNEVRTAFLTTAVINKWSKHKPVRLPVDFCQDFSSSASNYYPNWWKGYDGNCGMTLPIYTSPGSTSQGFIYDLMNGNFKWTYTPPTGTQQQPMRVGDFAEYKKDAINPVGQPSNFDLYKDINGYVTLGFDLAITAGDRYNLTLSDLEVSGVPLSNYYLGMIMFRGKNYTLVTSVNQMDSSDLSMQFKADGLSGSYTGRLFASSVKIDAGGSLTAGKFIPLDLNSFTVVVNDYGTLQSVLALGYWSSSVAIDFTVYIRNNGTGYANLNNVRVIAIEGEDPESGQTVGTVKEFGSVLVPGKGETTRTGRFLFSKEEGVTYWLAAMADNIKTTYTPVEDTPPEN